MTSPVKQMRLDGKGLCKVLGDLEAEIMDALWSSGGGTVGEVRASLRRRKPYSFNTVMTVMNRLVEKHVLEKRDRGGVFAYRPAVSRDRFQREVTRSVLSALISDGSLFHAAGFAEALRECSEDDRAMLARIIEEGKT